MSSDGLLSILNHYDGCARIRTHFPFHQVGEILGKLICRKEREKLQGMMASRAKARNRVNTTLKNCSPAVTGWTKFPKTTHKRTDGKRVGKEFWREPFVRSSRITRVYGQCERKRKKEWQRERTKYDREKRQYCDQSAKNFCLFLRTETKAVDLDAHYFAIHLFD